MQPKAGAGPVSGERDPCPENKEYIPFYHAAVTEPLVRDLIVLEVSSPTA